MRVYLDDDSASPLLLRLLGQAGHDVQRPADAGKSGVTDPIHLTHAILEGRTLLTGNHKDYEELHGLVRAARGHHPGILIVRRDNDPTRDLSPRGVVHALTRLLASGISVPNEVHVLNHWR